MSAPVQVGPSPVGGGPVPSSARLTRRVMEPGRYLTVAERRVLVLAANGYANKSIGVRLGISEQTVKTRMKAILRKLLVDDRAQASTVALRVGLIRIEEIDIPEGL